MLIFQVTPTSVEACACKRKSKGCQKERRGRSVTFLRCKKLFGWFRMGC